MERGDVENVVGGAGERGEGRRRDERGGET